MSLNLTEIRDQLLEAIDKAIKEGNWDSSLFFRNILKQLLEIREHIAQTFTEAGDVAPSLTPVAHYHAIPDTKEGYERVYIALYQAEGGRLDRWFSTIKMLTIYSVSRPVYRSEAEIGEVIRTKKGKSDAYVIAWVKQSDIIPSYSGSPLKDKWEHELLTLKEGSIKLENIVRFVHDEKNYYIHGEELVVIT